MTIPPELRALLDAYIAVTGIAITLSYQRQIALTELHARGITPQDVKGVLEKLKSLIARGEKGYGWSSLDFRNTLGNVDTFEERALKLRQERFRLSAKTRKQVPKTAGNITFLADATPEEPIQLSKDLMKETVRKLANEI